MADVYTEGKMKQWVSGLRGAVVIVLAWGGTWFFAGGMIELIENVAPGFFAFGSRVDIWPFELAVPGVAGGMAFTVLVALSGHRGSFKQLSLAGAALWGALIGMLLGAWALAAGTSSALFPGVWMSGVVVTSFTTAVSICAALGSVFFFRYLARGNAPASSEAT